MSTPGEGCQEPDRLNVPAEHHESSQDGILTFSDINEGRPHLVARTRINAKLVELASSDRGIANLQRAEVSNGHINWAAVTPDYRPPFVDIPRGNSSARKEGDRPDPDNPADVAAFNSIVTPHVARLSDGRPLNPMGRTGIEGRGMLDKWGETPAADLVVSRYNPVTGELEVASTEREDTGEWAIPGGKMDDHETPEETAIREFMEEAGGEGVDLRTGARIRYAGYSDDSRNTDNAWLSLVVLHRHLSPEEAERIVLRPENDKVRVEWRSPCSPFFAGQGQIVRRILGPYMRWD